MKIDVIDSKALKTTEFDTSAKLSSLHEGFSSSVAPEYNGYSVKPAGIDDNFNLWLGTESGTRVERSLEVYKMTVQQMYSGTTLSSGETTLGLKEIHEWKINPEYREQNIKQHSGYAAEVISTAKENMNAIEQGTGITTFRADDRPDLFPKNDKYVDKIRVNEKGEVIERIQTKFVGSDAKSCLSKLESKGFDKYFNDGMVDKVEIPKDFYPEIKEMLPERRANLVRQLERVKQDGKPASVIEGIERQIQRIDKIDDMIEQSTVTSDEAIYAVKHPKSYVGRLLTEDVFKAAAKSGLENAAMSASITVAVSTVDNISKVMDEEISLTEALADTALDTAIAGVAAGGTAFISTTVSMAMADSSHTLIKSLGKAGVPATAIAFGVESFDSISDYASGVIDGNQLIYDLGQNAAEIGGSIAGMAAVGAIAGSVLPGAGTAVGTAAGVAAGLVGGMVGTAVASEAYASVVQFSAEKAEVLSDKAKQIADKTITLTKEVVPDKVNEISASINNFAKENNLPFRV